MVQTTVVAEAGERAPCRLMMVLCVVHLYLCNKQKSNTFYEHWTMYIVQYLTVLHIVKCVRLATDKSNEPMKLYLSGMKNNKEPR